MSEKLQQYYNQQKQKEKLQNENLDNHNSQTHSLNLFRPSTNNGDEQLIKVFSNIQNLFQNFNTQKMDNKQIADLLINEFENMLRAQYFIDLYEESVQSNNQITKQSNNKKNYFMQFTNNQFKFPENSNLQMIKENLINCKNQKYKYAIVQLTKYGLKRYTDQSIQYQGKFSEIEMWNDIINDVYKVSPENGYDFIMADPAWDNTAINFNYTITSDDKWMKQIPLQKLQKKGGLLGMWITNAKLESCLNYLQQNEFERNDMVPWLKMKEDGSAEVSIGYYLLHGFELFILAKKKNCQQRIKEICNRQSALGIIVASRREASRKPDAQNYLMETFLKKETYKLELFARKFGWRNGWSGAGNESICLQKDIYKIQQYPMKCEVISEERLIKDENKQIPKKQFIRK